jgi:hypothetical protein
MTTEGNFPPRQLCLKPSLYGRFSLDHLWPLLRDHRGLRPKVMDDRLLLNIIIRKTESQKREVYAVYHGRFIEMVISHFPKLFSTAVATPSYTNEDSELNS